MSFLSGMSAYSRGFQDGIQFERRNPSAPSNPSLNTMFPPLSSTDPFAVCDSFPPPAPHVSDTTTNTGNNNVGGASTSNPSNDDAARLDWSGIKRKDFRVVLYQILKQKSCNKTFIRRHTHTRIHQRLTKTWQTLAENGILTSGGTKGSYYSLNKNIFDDYHQGTLFPRQEIDNMYAMDPVVGDVYHEVAAQINTEINDSMENESEDSNAGGSVGSQSSDDLVVLKGHKGKGVKGHKGKGGKQHTKGKKHKAKGKGHGGGKGTHAKSAKRPKKKHGSGCKESDDSSVDEGTSGTKRDHDEMSDYESDEKAEEEIKPPLKKVKRNSNENDEQMEAESADDDGE